jgi:hypothetical protein
MDDGGLVHNSTDGKFYYHFTGNYCNQKRDNNSCTYQNIYNPNGAYGNCPNSAMYSGVDSDYNPVTNTWSGNRLGVSGRPRSGELKYTFYDAKSNLIYRPLATGRKGIRFYKYSPISDSWTYVDDGSGIDFYSLSYAQPAHDLNNRMVYWWDPKKGKIYRYSIATNTTTLMSSIAPKGTNPRWSNTSMDWDSANSVILIPHFEDDDVRHTPMLFHVYKPSTDAWTKNITMNSWNGKRPAGRNVIYDRAHNLILVFGYVWDRVNGTNQMWFYRYGGGAGSEIHNRPATP